MINSYLNDIFTTGVYCEYTFQLKCYLWFLLCVSSEWIMESIYFYLLAY